MDEQSPPLLLDLGSFKALSVLGRGAKGVALLITKSNNGKTQTPIALKAISKSLIEKKKKEEDDPYKRIWFERYVLELFDHPLFPKLRGLVITNDIIGFAIDYCPGGHLNSLRTHQTERMFSDDIIRFYAAELVLALEYLHNLGVIYRDLKPENILIQETGHLMIVDFDLSTKLSPQTSPSTKLKNSSTKFLNRRRRLLWSWWLCNSNTGGGGAVVVDSAPSDSVPPKSNSFVGTIEYVAPEIILGNGHDFSVDWWSLGVTLYEMLYGYTPFRGIDRKETFYRILTKSPELVGERTPLRDLIGKLLQKDSAKRISVEEIKSHDFFKAVKWDHVLNISRPPFIPLPTHVTWEDEEDLEGIRGIDVELLVQQVVGGDDNVQKEKDDTDVRQIDKSKNNKNDENVGIKNGRNPWVDGLNNNPCKSSDFLVF